MPREARVQRQRDDARPREGLPGLRGGTALKCPRKAGGWDLDVAVGVWGCLGDAWRVSLGAAVTRTAMPVVTAQA